ncbi:MAG TPA: hypothetical protein PKC65_07105 [Pyrinomonadaceae bacterium]|nr:hypothetical protein [Pyrinomonadaceae bacterium]
MKQQIFILTTVVFAAICVVSASGQTSARAETTKGVCPVRSASELKTLGNLSEKDELRYHTPIRYIIVYNEIGPTGIREIEIFMNESNINERDLRTVFCWIGQRFPSPVALEVKVHTNLNAVETPEERELLKDGEDSRFSKYYGRYKEASYSRFDDGRETFLYTTDLSEIRQRLIVIREAAH